MARAPKVSNPQAVPAIPVPVAIIDVGSTSLRMLVAQLMPNGSSTTIDTLQQPVGLGRDTFTKGYLEKSTIEECVGVLRMFKTVLKEYGITAPRQIRAVASSAVREAANRDLFLDRVYIATEIAVELLDEAEANRFAYLAVQPQLAQRRAKRMADTFIVEVGGGNTNVLLLEKQTTVAFSRSYRLGAFRLREIIEHSHAPAVRFRTIVENHIHTTLQKIHDQTRAKKNYALVIMGNDARFAAQTLVPDWDHVSLCPLALPAFARFTNKIIDHTPDALVRAYHFSYGDAETLGPALVFYTRLAQMLRVRTLLVSAATVRDGIILEMATPDAWTTAFRAQIIHAAEMLGAKYDYDRAHARHVTALCRKLFTLLAPQYHLSARYELILTLAALLHDIGQFIEVSGHHKHALYLITHSNLFGLGARDIVLVAVVARYHRKALPSLSHPEFSALDRESRMAVHKLAAILRVCDALDRRHIHGPLNVDFALADNQLVITLQKQSDMSIEQLALRDKANMFEQVYGMSVVLRRADHLQEAEHEAV